MDDIKINLLEGSGIPPPNATVTCSEAIIPTSSLTQSHRPAESASTHGSYSSMTNESAANLPPSYNVKDGYPEPSFDTGKMFPDFRDNHELSRESPCFVQSIWNASVPIRWGKKKQFC